MCSIHHYLKFYSYPFCDQRLRVKLYILQHFQLSVKIIITLTICLLTSERSFWSALIGDYQQMYPGSDCTINTYMTQCMCSGSGIKQGRSMNLFENRVAMPVGFTVTWIQSRKHCYLQDLGDRGYNIGTRAQRNVRRIGEQSLRNSSWNISEEATEDLSLRHKTGLLLKV